MMLNLSKADRQEIRDYYALKQVPGCRICGAEMVIERTDLGRTTWRCAAVTNDLHNGIPPMSPEFAGAIQHYADSAFAEYGPGHKIQMLLDDLEAIETVASRLYQAVKVAWERELNACEGRGLPPEDRLPVWNELIYAIESYKNAGLEAEATEASCSND